ncbi:MAG: hypothetical protein A2Y23_13350 [Clostridiales bacterium GWB2_37_7]|nr:MAG: hypothetical protein A2Y23_13350 [Clostridiales bacterium GWB2_37_7]
MEKCIYLDIDMDFFVAPIEKESVDNIRLYHDGECNTFPIAPMVDKLYNKGIRWDRNKISVFTNHKTSYTHWWIKKKQNNILVHIDAHSDLYRNSNKDLRLLHNGEIGCYNYIWYGIRDCYIGEVYWVIPDSMIGLLDVEKAGSIINSSLIVEITLDVHGLHILMECIVITGEVRQIPIHVCTLDQLPYFEENCDKVTIATSPEFVPSACDEVVFELIECFGATKELAQNIYNQHKTMLNKTPEEYEEAWRKINKIRTAY